MTVQTITHPGVVLGTVGYMAPEQVRGLAVDHRADLFAFGAILYELLSGSRAFARPTAPETMSAILNDDPPDIGAGTPIAPALARIVTRCLEKNPSERFQTASDLAFALAGVSDGSSAQASSRVPSRPFRVTRWLPWLAAVIAVAALLPIAIAHLREQPPAPSAMQFQIPPGIDFGGPGNFGISPDGQNLAFVGLGADGVPRVWIRAMASPAIRALAGSETMPVTPPPFWSPDSRFVAFDAGNKLKKFEVAGGVPQTLADLPGVGVGGSWNRTGDILVGNTSGGILRVRETGGTLTEVTAVEYAQKEEAHMLPTFLPDGRHFIYLRAVPGAPDAGGIYVASLDAKPEEQRTHRLLPYHVGPAFVPSSDPRSGWLMYLREGTLVAQTFDATRLELTGDPVAVAERVGAFRDGAYFTASANNALIYRSADIVSDLVWYDRQGNVAGRLSESAPYRSVALSPDGSRAVVSRTSQQDTTKADLWLLNLSQGSAATRLTLGAGIAEYPIWSRDGRYITYTLNNNTIHQIPAGGEGGDKELVRSANVGLLVANEWSPDNSVLLYSGFSTSSAGVGNLDLKVLTADRQSVPFAATAFNEWQGRFAPNGKWVAYVSDQSGLNEIYVRQIADGFSGGSASVGGSVRVSQGGGTSPRWRGDGRELYYLAPNGKVIAVDVTTPDREFRGGTPTPLFQTPIGTAVGDVTADGKRFLLVTPTGPNASVFTVVLNWTSTLRK